MQAPGLEDRRRASLRASPVGRDEHRRAGPRTAPMPDIELSRPHGLGLDGARRAVDEVADRLRRELGVTTRREGDVVHVEGRGVSGRLEAGPAEVRVEASLGLRARPFKRVLRREIEAELDRLAPLPTD